MSDIEMALFAHLERLDQYDVKYTGWCESHFTLEAFSSVK